MRRLLLLLVLCALAAPVHAQAPADPALDAFFDAWLRAHPLDATSLGVHAYDHELPAFDEATLAAWAKTLRRHRAAIAKPPRGCDEACRIDHTVVVQHIDAELFDLEQLRSLDRWPDTWVSLATGAVFPIVKRDFAPLPERAQAVRDRLRRLPALLASARAHLLGPHALVAPIAVAIALEDLPGARAFLHDDVPKAFAALPPDALAGLRADVDVAIRALDELKVLLEKEIAPKAQAAIAIGPALLAKKLALEEMIDEPLEPLLARGEAELRRLQGAFREAARAVDPKLDAKAVQAKLGLDHPAPAAVIPEVVNRLVALRGFIDQHHLVTIPSAVMPIVDETPAFERSMVQASMDSPGAFEAVAHEAYYHLTLPDAAWPKARAENYLAGALNRSLLDVVSIHEAFPGHYLQFLWVPKLASRARRMVYAASNVEGWAHYCEQMVLDAGWAADRPSVRLAQVVDALLRAARYVVAIRMHARGMSVAEAERFFVEEGLQSKEVAIVEAKRATEDPTFLYYTWGKLELLRLRAELEQKWGEKFSLQRFHDAVMAEGPLPLPLLRKAILSRP